MKWSLSRIESADAAEAVVSLLAESGDPFALRKDAAACVRRWIRDPKQQCYQALSPEFEPRIMAFARVRRVPDDSLNMLSVAPYKLADLLSSPLPWSETAYLGDFRCSADASDGFPAEFESAVCEWESAHGVKTMVVSVAQGDTGVFESMGYAPFASNLDLVRLHRKESFCRKDDVSCEHIGSLMVKSIENKR